MAEITKRSEDYSRWYQDVIAAAELAEHSPVRGCMVIRPNGYAIWENVQRILDERFKATGHVNAYFPLLIPKSFLAREAQHVEGFAKECAIVTHHRLKTQEVDGRIDVVPDPESRLEEEYIIRPTSETIIWDMYRKWIQSYRDLPILINQWANVMRWELRTRLFLRTTEFLWQEGHTAHATAAEGRAEALRMLEVYRWFAEEILAMPVVAGPKTPSERFAGAVETYAIEAMMQDGKALQAATSHDLGQNFARAFDVTFQDADGERQLVWATSWGLSTRIIGALIMTHSDDNGLVLPPRIASRKAVVVPIWKNDEEKAAVLETAHRLVADLEPRFGLVPVDDRDKMRPGWKYAEWEARGVPVRIEIGPRDVQSGQAVLVARHDRRKAPTPQAGLADALAAELDRIQHDLYEAALRRRAAGTRRLDRWEDFVELFREGGEGGFALCHWSGEAEVERQIQEETGATIRVVPFDREDEPGVCIRSGRPSPGRVLFAQAY